MHLISMVTTKLDFVCFMCKFEDTVLVTMLLKWEILSNVSSNSIFPNFNVEFTVFLQLGTDRLATGLVACVNSIEVQGRQISFTNADQYVNTVLQSVFRPYQFLI